MHILIAPNAFKNSLTATEAAIAIEQGIQDTKLPVTTERFPVCDGGDGTCALMVERFNGRIVTAEVEDPLGRPITAQYGFIDNGDTAIIEMAEASGMRRLHKSELNPMKANSFGTGQLMVDALNQGARKIILALGGSATVDGGTGMLRALGLKLRDINGNETGIYPESLPSATSVDLTGMDKRILETQIVVLCDVQTALLGSMGATALFGPQKGATPEQLPLLEAGLENLAKLALEATGKDIQVRLMTGTAGGAAGGMLAFTNAKLEPGIEYYLAITDFESALKRTTMLFTGEGSLDEQTLQGKAPMGVAIRASQHRIPVVAFAGKVPAQPSSRFANYFSEMVPINKSGKSNQLKWASHNLRLAVTRFIKANC